MPSHQSSTSSSSRDRLLDAARRLFAAQGYEQTATSAIARDAGTSESQLMRYFGGKAGLLDALLEDSWAELHARVRRAVARFSDPHERLLEAAHAVVRTLGRDADFAVLLLFETRRLRATTPRVRRSTSFLEFADAFCTLVREAQATGNLDRSLDAAAVTSAVLGAAEGMARDRMLIGARRGFAEREVIRTLDAILLGLREVAGRSSPRSAPGAKRSPKR